MSKHLFIALFSLSLLFVATAAPGKEAGPPAQSLCPISGQPVDEKYFVDVDGFRVFTAGQAEAEQVRRNPAGAFAALAKNREAAVPVVWICPSMKNEVTPADRFVQQAGKRIYYCCPPCRPRINADFGAAAAIMKQLAEQAKS